MPGSVVSCSTPACLACLLRNALPDEGQQCRCLRQWLHQPFFTLTLCAGAAAGFAVVLFDDALQLARRRPPIQLATGWSCLPYLFGVAIYCFEVRGCLRAVSCARACPRPPHLHAAVLPVNFSSIACRYAELYDSARRALSTQGGNLPQMQGVGMILPIEASMHTPRHFDAVLAATMSAVTALYVGFGSVRWLPAGSLSGPTHECCLAAQRCVCASTKPGHVCCPTMLFHASYNLRLDCKA